MRRKVSKHKKRFTTPIDRRTRNILGFSSDHFRPFSPVNPLAPVRHSPLAPVRHLINFMIGTLDHLCIIIILFFTGSV